MIKLPYGIDSYPYEFGNIHLINENKQVPAQITNQVNQVQMFEIMVNQHLKQNATKWNDTICDDMELESDQFWSWIRKFLNKKTECFTPNARKIKLGYIGNDLYLLLNASIINASDLIPKNVQDDINQLLENDIKLKIRQINEIRQSINQNIHQIDNVNQNIHQIDNVNQNIHQIDNVNQNNTITLTHPLDNIFTTKSQNAIVSCLGIHLSGICWNNNQIIDCKRYKVFWDLVYDYKNKYSADTEHLNNGILYRAPQDHSTHQTYNNLSNLVSLINAKMDQTESNWYPKNFQMVVKYHGSDLKNHFDDPLRFLLNEIQTYRQGAASLTFGTHSIGKCPAGRNTVFEVVQQHGDFFHMPRMFCIFL